MPDYTEPSSWDAVWARPYDKYEEHHKVFWNLIRDIAEAPILDLGCGSSSCWRGYDHAITGVDFSPEAIRQSQKNCPTSKFYQASVDKTPLPDHLYQTIVLCGVVNYYEDLDPIMREANRLVKPGGLIVITINVIDDFPSRSWTEERIDREFGAYGMVNAEFYEKVGWFVVISVSP
jgi:SAM-dependent methyltransferase